MTESKESLNLSRASLNPKNIFTVLQRLQGHKSTLTTLNLWCNSLGHDGIKVVAGVLHELPRLKSLNIGFCNVCDKGMTLMCEELKSNITICQVNAGLNHVSDVSAKAIADIIKENKTLTSLHLDSNNISDVGAKYIADSIRFNTTLRELNLENNDIHDGGAKALCAALKHNSHSSLALLNLDNNKLSPESMQDLNECLKRNDHGLLWSGFALDLFSKHDVAQEFQCAVCLDVTRRPLETPCGHIFCSACVLSIEDTADHDIATATTTPGRVTTERCGDGFLCPQCRKRCMRTEIKTLSPFATRLLMSLEVYCRYAGRGCAWRDTLSHFDNHVLQCAAATAPPATALPVPVSPQSKQSSQTLLELQPQ